MHLLNCSTLFQHLIPPEKNNCIIRQPIFIIGQIPNNQTKLFGKIHCAEYSSQKINSEVSAYCIKSSFPQILLEKFR
jgi:hypothetical protein